MSVFDKAWNFLKALPEQQLHHYDKPILQNEYTRQRGPLSHSRFKTLHPAIVGMLERRGALDPRGNYLDYFEDIGVESGYDAETGERSSGAKPFRDESKHNDPYQTPEDREAEEAYNAAELRGIARGDVI